MSARQALRGPSVVLGQPLKVAPDSVVRRQVELSRAHCEEECVPLALAEDQVGSVWFLRIAYCDCAKVEGDVNTCAVAALAEAATTPFELEPGLAW